MCNKEYTNTAMLFTGPVGCGKSWTVEQVAQQCDPVRSVVDYESSSYFFAASEEDILEGLRSSICVSLGRKIVSIDLDGLSDRAAAAVTTLVRSLVGKRLRAAQPLLILSTLKTQHARAIRSIVVAARKDAVVQLTVAIDGVQRATGTIMRSIFGGDVKKWPRPLPTRIGALQRAAAEHKDLRRFRLEMEQLFEPKPEWETSSFVCAACSSPFDTEDELQQHMQAVCGMGAARIKDVWALITQMCSGVTKRSGAWQQLAESYDPYTVVEAFAANYLMFAPQPPLPQKYKCKEVALSQREQSTIDALEELTRAAECASDAAALLWRPTAIRCEGAAASMALHMTASAPQRKKWTRNEQMSSLNLMIRHGKLGDGAENVRSWRPTRESVVAELARRGSSA